MNDLRRQQSSIFIVATNRLRSFDAAVVRPGRFDLLLFVGTPNRSSRMARLSSKLENAGLPEDRRKAAEDLVDSYMERHWDSMRFFTFAENEALLKYVTEMAVSESMAVNDGLMAVASLSTI